MNYAEIKKEARERLRGNWGIIVIAYLVMNLIIGTAETIFMFSDTLYFIGSLSAILLTGPLTYGFSLMVLKISRRQKTETGDLFVGFNSYQRTLMAGVDITVRVVLWSLLFVIPGIIASYSYSMTYYLMADNPSITSTEAINKSKEMMKGHKMELFVLELTFIGWALLATIFTFGIGLLWVSAYMETAKAEFYKKLSGVYTIPDNNQTTEEEPKVVTAEEVKPYSGTMSDATVVYNLKCPSCGAKETHTEKTMGCPYCDATMQEDK